MPSLKEYKAKLASLNNTRKITKTMKMVAASRLHRAMDAQRKATGYAESLMAMIGRLTHQVDPASHPLLQKRDPSRNTLLLLFSSDKGLCGGFNNNLFRATHRWLRHPERANRRITVAFCGRRGMLAFRSAGTPFAYYEHVTVHPKMVDAIRIARELCGAFCAGRFDEVFLGYNHFSNALTQTPVFHRILPIEPEEVAAGEVGLHADLILEPKEHALLDLLLPKTIEFEVYYALLENAAGENGARMTAMDNATTNATQMITLYTLLRNRARQAAITKELIEIISGADALKG